ncbi:hypothetical protein BpOF4_04145 [Alkalihalophilus pseudofirmus OF4]|uniref:Uncharacterized protein n=1 Tax=Alkalihalophilus pseudofirmus (strain ATCC BAA-2126 / JCM 17055 / OF4) TaxID=398511 RepID=D3FXQ8_ALKPO|nr:hypothetical protein BpOF4_04145 [Alkalihalophilus pseudofirmus OF4]
MNKSIKYEEMNSGRSIILYRRKGFNLDGDDNKMTLINE